MIELPTAISRRTFPGIPRQDVCKNVKKLTGKETKELRQIVDKPDDEIHQRMLLTPSSSRQTNTVNHISQRLLY